jgi:preprotein translocase subunit SecE
MGKVSVAQFVREVRQESNKVTWPDRKETMTTAAMVFAMAVISAVFFLLSDFMISKIISFIFKANLEV